MSPRLYEPLRRDPQIAATWIVPCVAMAVVACASKSAENFKVEQPLDSRIKERGGSRIRVNLDSCWSYSTHRIFSIRRLNCLSKGPLTVSKQNENECSGEPPYRRCSVQILLCHLSRFHHRWRKSLQWSLTKRRHHRSLWIFFTLFLKYSSK